MALFDIDLGSSHHDHKDLEPETPLDSGPLDKKFHEEAQETPDKSATVAADDNK